MKTQYLQSEQPMIHRIRLVYNTIEYGSTNRNIYTIKAGDPLSAKVQCDWTLTVGRGEWQTSLETTSTMTAD